MKGFCECGCGRKTKISKWSDKRYGYVKNKPRRFISGHNGRKFPTPYTIENRGYKTPCWIWRWHINRGGYALLGAYSVPKGQSRYAHRQMYMKSGKTIPDGLELDHLCRIRCCVNPKHLEPVTKKENARRGANAKLTLEQIEQAIQMRREGKMMKEIAPIFGITIAYLEVLCRRAKVWIRK